ncbi:Cyclic di-GMP phosphodiesterase Gmr [Thiorhodovibrio litoralis]|nr:EAL domain-containing protein [Thiorhodovibrio winogradskyi]MBK5967588.1 GGDEF domain-containing protein [Thiorhodovibrio winogradskyi]WPL14938.1 Cyclic di-GMP phosphodiesterase Gmr [Thiorhodovibrio litoralis]
MSKTKSSDFQREKPLEGQGFAVKLVQQLVIPTFVLDAECKVIVWNEACERLTGMPAEEVLGTREHWRAFYGEPRPCLVDLIVLERTGEIGHFYDSHEVRPGQAFAAHAENWCVMPLLGSELYLSIDAGLIRDETGRVIGAVETLRDMSESKLADRKLRLIASVFEHSQEGIVITDPKASILDVNASFTRVTGYSREEALGQTPALLKSGLQEASFYQDLWSRLHETGQWQGEIWNRKKSGEVYPEILHINAVKNAAREVTHYVGMFIDITDLKHTQQRLEALAHYDALTDLPNRVLLAERLHQTLSNAKRFERLVAICFLDLDDFKLVNDRHGHEIGDRLLIEIANRLRGTLRGGDTVARLGGDEFVLLLAELDNANELEAILDRIFDAVAKPFRTNDIDLGVSASIGVTLYPFDDSDPDTLLRHADQAMYLAKQQGRNRYHLFDQDAARELRDQHRELDRIREALQHGEFRLYYQPKVNMRTGEVVGMEALIRWQHPERGLLGPMEFLPSVEKLHMIVDIGEWVLHEALAQMEQWALNGEPIAVSVNIAARQFQHIDFVARLRAILAEHPDVPAHLLELEILESTALEDVDMMREVMAACQAIGVTFALDDFGTGYSSLSYLKQLPAETLKIDQSFVRDMLDDQEDLAIIEGVIGLASVFNKKVIAEGVETAEHGVLLMHFGCDCAQGYGIGYPMPAAEVAAWTRAFTPDWKWDHLARNEWDGIDMPLLLAQYEHIKWVQRVIGSAKGADIDMSRDELENPGRCRFGVWYAGEGKKRYGHLPEYQEIDAIHRRIHEVGTEIIRLNDGGESESLSGACDELLALKGQILDRLSRLQQMVATVLSAAQDTHDLNTTFSQSITK